jgi:Phosphodiester glycosidase
VLPLPSAGVLLRRVVTAALFVVVVAVPGVVDAATPVRGQTLMPNVVYSRQVEFTAHGPVVEHILVAPRPTGLYALKPILSNNAVQGTERVTSMQKRVSGDATVAGINGGGGTLVRDGVLDMQPADKRSSVGIDTDGTLHVDRVVLAGTWQGSGQRRILGLNEPPRANRATVYTRAWGARTPADSGGAYAVLQPFPASRPNTPLTATVTGYLPGGNQPIPADGAVLVARGAQAGFLTAEAPVGSKVTVVLTLTPPWANVTDGLGGGPLIVRDGKPVYRSFENFTTQALAFRSGRSAIGQTADGRIVLLVADGRQPGYSTGLTNFELALTMMRLGCVTASALDSGAAATMAFDGKLLNRPSRRGEGAVGDALTLFYYGVYAPPLQTKAVTQTGSLTLAYKLVEPSTVTAVTVGPTGDVIPVDADKRGPGTYRFNWAALGRPAGEYTFRITADDDEGRHSVAERDFTVGG